MTTSLITQHPFSDAYAGQAGRLPAALDGLRRDARARVAAGLPGSKVEEWRFTPLTDLAKVGFIPAVAADDIDVVAVPSDVPHVPGALRLVLVNGAYSADLSDKIDGVEVRRLADTQGVVGRVASLDLPLVALNTAFVSDGLVIDAKKTITRPIHIISIGASGATPVAFHPRLAITTAPGASVTVIESHVGLPGQPFFANPVAEISVAEDATVRRYVTVTEEGDAYHFATAVVEVGARATFEAFHLGLGGHRAEGTARQEIHIAVKGEGAQVNLGGAYAIAGTMHHDFTTVIDHCIGGSHSKQLFKGVLDDKSHGVYQGRVKVARDAQKTDARQLHRALFLTHGPAVDCKPELEIDADDVQCAHGATTGALDPDQLFYLNARGIHPDDARALLVEGFLVDALNEISNETVRDIFTAQVAGWLRRRGERS
jgi:Fe-S cluster assembly protein SufD